MADYIERQAVIEAAKHAWAKGLEPTQYIEEIPTENVREDVRSNWVQEISRKPFLSVLYKCEKCGHLVDRVSNFCPNCGARMAVGGER